MVRFLYCIGVPLTIKISYFLFCVCEDFAIYHCMEGVLPHINEFFSSCFSSTSPAIKMVKWVHEWP